MPFSPSLIFGDANTMYAFAGDRTRDTQGYLAALSAATVALVPDKIAPEWPTIDKAPDFGTTTPPTLEPVTWAYATIPPQFTGTLDVSAYMPSGFNKAAPDLVIPGQPGEFAAPLPDAPPVNTNFVFPADLDIDQYLPTQLPQLLSINVAQFGGVNMPAAISSDVPELTLVQPADFHYTPGAAYTSGLLTSLKSALQDRIDNGGTGLAPAVEQAIWDRGRERETKQLADAIADLERMEALGYALPPGGYVDARLKLQTEFAAQAHGYSREVMIKAAELEQENVKHALTTATQLESKLVDYINQIEQRNFEAQKYATQAGLEIYNARIKAYSAYLDAWKVKVQIYLGQIEGEKAKVEAYKAQVQAEEAKATVNTALVTQYKTQIDAAMAHVQIYKAELDAVQTHAQIEKMKIEIFGEQVKAYAAQVNTYTARVEAFKAVVGAEGTKQEAFKAQVDAYAAQVGAETKVIEAKIREFESKIKANEAQWEGYKAYNTGEASRVSALSAVNSAKAEVFKAEVQGKSAYNEALIKEWSSKIEIAEKITEVGISAAKANAELYMTQRSLTLDAAKVGAQVSAQLGAAALNAINWSSSISQSQSESISQSDSRSQSYSYSYGVSTSTSYTP